MVLSQGVWEGFFVEGLQRSWEMASRGLDLQMIVNLHDVVERRFSEMFSQFETSLADQVKDGVRKAFHRCLWSRNLLI